MHFYKAYGLHIHSEVELPELESDIQSEPDLKISLGQVHLPDLQETKIFRRGIKAKFGQAGSSRLFLQWAKVADFEAIDGHSLVINSFTNDRELLSLFTVSEALGLILFQRGYFLLHASSVNVGDEAWCFMGDPGAGKSTSAAAFVKAGCPLLSDDLTAIFFKNNVAFVLPAYPQLKIWENTATGLDYADEHLRPLSEGLNKFSHIPDDLFCHEPVKLAHIFFLTDPSETPVLERLPPSEAPTELLRHFPLAVHMLTPDVIKNHFMQSLKCYQAASLWKKSRDQNFEQLEKWVKTSVDTLMPVAQP